MMECMIGAKNELGNISKKMKTMNILYPIMHLITILEEKNAGTNPKVVEKQYTLLTINSLIGKKLSKIINLKASLVH